MHVIEMQICGLWKATQMDAKDSETDENKCLFNAWETHRESSWGFNGGFPLWLGVYVDVSKVRRYEIGRFRKLRSSGLDKNYLARGWSYSISNGTGSEYSCDSRWNCEMISELCIRIAHCRSRMDHLARLVRWQIWKERWYRQIVPSPIAHS